MSTREIRIRKRWVITFPSWNPSSIGVYAFLTKREIDDLCICFYGGEPLLKTRTIYKDHGHVPQCQILFPGSDHSSLWSLDERHIVEDSEVRLFTSCWYNSLLYRWPSRNYESLPWSRNLRAYHGECRLHQECRVQERYCCSNDGVGWATGWHLRGSHANLMIVFVLVPS